MRKFRAENFRVKIFSCSAVAHENILTMKKLHAQNFSYISICRHLANAMRNAVIMHFVINEHDIMGVKISLVRKQCVPDLRFPPMQYTKALRRWYFNALLPSA